MVNKDDAVNTNGMNRLKQIEIQRFTIVSKSDFFEQFEKHVLTLKRKYKNCIPLLPLNSNIGGPDPTTKGIVINLNDEMFRVSEKAFDMGNYETIIHISDLNNITYCIFEMSDMEQDTVIVFPVYFSSNMKSLLGESKKLLLFFINAIDNNMIGTSIENNPFN